MSDNYVRLCRVNVILCHGKTCYNVLGIILRRHKVADVKWIKIVTDIFNDEKILLIDSLPERDSIIVIWLKLLCMAGKQNNGGVLMMNERVAYTDEMLATISRRPLSSVRLALSIFEQYGMIEIVNNAVTIPKWEYHQNIDGLQKIKEQTKERVRKYRERQKQQSVSCNVTETCCNDTDKNRTDKKKQPVRLP